MSYTNKDILTQTVSPVVTTAALWLPDIDGTDTTTARVLSDEHGGKITLLNSLIIKKKEEESE